MKRIQVETFFWDAKTICIQRTLQEHSLNHIQIHLKKQTNTLLNCSRIITVSKIYIGRWEVFFLDSFQASPKQSVIHGTVWQYVSLWQGVLGGDVCKVLYAVVIIGKR